MGNQEVEENIDKKSSTDRFCELIVAEREKAGFSLDRAASATRITMVFMKAIEQGELQTLPGYVFGRGFVQSLCRVYGSDQSEALLELYKAACFECGCQDIGMGQPVKEDPATSGIISKKQGSYTLTSIWRGLRPGHYFRATPLYLFQGALLLIGLVTYLLVDPFGDSTEDNNVTLLGKGKKEGLPIGKTIDKDPEAVVTAQEEVQTEDVMSSLPSKQQVSMTMPKKVNLKYKIDGKQWVQQDLEPDNYIWEFQDRAEFYIKSPEGIAVSYNEQPIGPLQNIAGHNRITFSKPVGQVKVTKF